MQALQTVDIQCAYCGETIEILVDASAGDQQYIEDCQVCCRPLVMNVHIDADGDAVVNARYADE